MSERFVPTPDQRTRYHQRLDEALLEGSVTRARFSDWETMSKDEHGEPRVTPLHGTRFEVEFAQEPPWPTVMRVESGNFRRKAPRLVGGIALEKTVILPDLQIPYQDPDALNVALQITRDVKPNRVVFLGDTVDLSAWSTYEQRPEYAEQTQKAIVELHLLLAGLRRTLPKAEIVVLSGNHEARMSRALLRNTQAAYGLKRADDLDGWPVMSLPHLAAFDTLDIEYVDGYPANRYWINDRLQVRHGNVAKPSGQTARSTTENERVSTIVGHSHRIESYYKTVNVFEGGRTNVAYNIGTLCLLSGTPGVNSGVDQRSNEMVENYANWQQGLMIVESEPGDGPFNAEQIYINTFDNYRTSYRGKIYKPYDWSLDDSRT